MKKILSLTISLVLLLFVLSSCGGSAGTTSSNATNSNNDTNNGGASSPTAEAEPNNSGDQAQVISSVQSTVSGTTSGNASTDTSTNATADYDFFAVTPSTSGIATITLSNYGTAHLNLLLFSGTKDGNGRYPVLAMSGTGTDTNTTQTVIYTLTAGQKYIIGVQPWTTSDTTSYLLEITAGGDSTFPTITGFDPTSGTAGTQVTITGANFSSTAANNLVSFNGIQAAVTSSSATSIVATVPAGATSGPVSVQVGTQTVWSASNFTVGSVQNLPVITAPSSINSATTWTTGNVYVVQSSISVNAALTIEPGTIVKFEQGTSLSVNTNGSIIADGQSASTPIIFTSIKDDTYGGDTNGDGAASTAARGDWAYVKVTTSGTFNYCVFSYGGSTAPYTGTLSLQNNSVATVTNCTIAYNKGGTLTDYRGAAFNAQYAGAGTVITGNTFYGNDMPIVVNSLYDVDNSNVFHKLTGGGTITNTYNGIFWEGNYSQMGTAITWSNTEVPYVTTGPIGVPAGSTLTLGDGVVLKFDADERIDVSGVLISNATTSIVFTSLKDDSVGGDTNGDGAATSPAPGDWRGIDVSASGSIFNKCVITYGGSAKPIRPTLAVTNNATATITNCTFAHNAGGTLSDIRAAALNIGGSAAGTIITGNTFYGNDLPLVINGRVNLDNSNTFHQIVSDGTATVTVTNTYNGIFMDGVSHTVTGSVTWSNTEVPYVINNNTVLGIGDADGATLTLGNNVILKLQSARIDVLQFGTITQGTGNFFTSLKDDTLLGDTNGDGASTTPVKGDWTGVNVCSPFCSYSAGGNILYATNP